MTETTTFQTQCVFCHTIHTITVDAEKFNRWRAGGEHIQNVWPSMTPDEREIMISGTCSGCWDTYMKEEE
jgi:hypothetical protein